jgi:hypothetical protein
MQTALRVVAMSIAGGAAALTFAAPASAAPAAVAETQASSVSSNTVPAATPADSNGICYVYGYSTSAWGWCDGTGPQRYGIYAACSNGYVYESSSQPWFGDRRGAWVYCPSGTVLDYAWGGYA